METGVNVLISPEVTHKSDWIPGTVIDVGATSTGSASRFATFVADEGISNYCHSTCDWNYIK